MRGTVSCIRSFLKSCEALLMLINGEFLTVGCAFECFLYK